MSGKMVEGSKEFYVEGCGGTMFILSADGKISINWEVVEMTSKMSPIFFKKKQRYMTVILTAKALMSLKP